jgi:ring-1,2-phenylacetyl-CoA epoxidase subunit PaaC
MSEGGRGGAWTEDAGDEGRRRVGAPPAANWEAEGDLFEYVLRLGDDALVAAQRLAEWCSRAPEMEEDVALANIALDQLGAARLLLTYAGELEGAGRDEDTLAYLRGDREYRNCLLVELPNPDFGVTIAKLLFLSQYQVLLYEWLVASRDERLSAIAGKLRKESAYHVDHSSLWTVRLGDGTDESHRRMQAAVDEVWPYTHELFAGDEVDPVDPAGLRPAWLSIVEPVLAEATLRRPADGWAPAGGRRGRHTEHLSYLLAELQVLHRAHPGAVW